MESDITGKSQINWQLLWISFSANYDLKQTYHNLHTCYIRVDSGTADIIILAVFVHHNKWASWKNCFHKLHFCCSSFLFSHSAFSSTRDLFPNVCVFCGTLNLTCFLLSGHIFTDVMPTLAFFAFFIPLIPFRGKFVPSGTLRDSRGPVNLSFFWHRITLSQGVLSCVTAGRR